MYLFWQLQILDIIFLFWMNLNAVWIHRLDRPHWKGPFKAPIWLVSISVLLGYMNLVFLGMGTDLWGSGTLLTGLIFAALIIPVFHHSSLYSR